ncbi:MAG: serine/threonine protein kinase [Actinomycetota bacterium]|nr:serine/threonine protein kinase [Actinomycetota bacterium]
MSMVPRVGTELAGYRIESVLGRGGMAIVYLAEHLRLGRKVALKVMAPELADDERFRERFISESRLAASLHDPNVMPIYDAGETDGVLYIAMRLVEGSDLKTIIVNEAPLDLRRTVSIIRQAANALDAAHAAGLIHRDVKPANMLVTPASGSRSEHVYLTDFGLTKRADSKTGYTKTGTFVGSIDYLAPERIEGNAPPTGQVDVYSLGCVLFECLTGRVPFVKDNDMSVMWAHMNEPPPRVTASKPNLPPAIDQVVARAMAKAPEDRFASCGDLASAAEAVAASADTGATVTGPPDSSMTHLRPEPMPQSAQTEAASRSFPAAPPAPAAPAAPAPLPGPPPVEQPGRRPIEREPRERERTRRPAWVLPIAALLAVALAAGGYLLGKNTAGTTPGKSPRATGGPVPIPAGSGCTDLNGNPVSVGGTEIAADSITCLLAKHVPAEIRDGCVTLNGKTDAAKLPLPGAAQQPPVADVFLLCDHVSFGGNTFTAWYMFKHDRDEVGVDYQQILTSNHIAVNENANQQRCATIHPIERRWYVEKESLDPAGAATNVVHTFDTKQALPFSKFYPVYGRFTCFQDGADEWIAWTDANLTVLTVAKSAGGNWDKLQTWWATDAGPGHPPIA